MVAIALAVALAVGGSVACTGTGSDVPEALTSYLDALVAGKYRVAYDRTALGALADTSPEASTLSFEHFAAFLAADPLLSYDVDKVTTLDRRSIGAAQEVGTPYFVADVTLRHRSGASKQTLSVEGAVLAVVEIDPVPVRLRGAGTVVVDGVPVPALRSAKMERTVLLLAGAHRIAIGNAVALIHTSPLRVTSGAGRVADGVLLVG